MAETPEQTLMRVSSTLKKCIDEAFSPKFTKKLAKQTAGQVVRRTRLGYGVSQLGQQVKLYALSDSYKAVRRGKLRFYTNKSTQQIFTVGESPKSRPSRSSKRKKSLFKRLKGAIGKSKPRKSSKPEQRLKNLSPFTSPGKSNLTATGGMLDSITGLGRKAKIIIEIPDKRHGPDLFGNPVDLSHADLARVHQKGATVRHPSGVVIRIPTRRFFDLSNAEKKGVIRRVRQFILKCTRARLG